MRKISWDSFKQFVSTKKAPVQFVDFTTHYLIQAKDGYFEYETVIVKDSNLDQTNFESGIKLTANQTIIDTDGTVITRNKAAKTGWTYGLIPTELTTATVGSKISKLVDGTDRNGITVKFYDINDVEVTDGANDATIVKTVFDFEPAYDYEIIGGEISHITPPTTDVRVYVIGVPDVAAIYGGSKEMAGGINMKFIAAFGKVEADGRVAKFMKHDTTYHTGKIRFIFKHDAGVKHTVMVLMSIFKA